jgi:hypothetical protein
MFFLFKRLKIVYLLLFLATAVNAEEYPPAPPHIGKCLQTGVSQLLVAAETTDKRRLFNKYVDHELIGYYMFADRSPNRGWKNATPAVKAEQINRIFSTIVHLSGNSKNGLNRSTLVVTDELRQTLIKTIKGVKHTIYQVLVKAVDGNARKSVFVVFVTNSCKIIDLQQGFKLSQRFSSDDLPSN